MEGLQDTRATPPKPSTPIRTSCANCLSAFDCNKPSSTIHEVYDLKFRKAKEFSTFEALWLTLKGRSPPPPSPDLNSINTRKDTSLCSRCGIRFSKLIYVYQDFLSLTAVGSFVRKLVTAEVENFPPSSGRQMETVKIQLMKVNCKESPTCPVPFGSISSDRKVAFAKVVLPPSPSTLKSGSIEVPTDFGLPPPLPSTSKRRRKSPIRTEMDSFHENMDTHGACEFDSGDWDTDIGLRCDGELFNDGKASPAAAPPLQSAGKWKRHGENKGKKNSRIRKKRKQSIVNPLGRKAPPPCLLSEEDQKLLITTSYKCDECVDSPQAFETLQQWVLHHLETHQQDLGYGDADGIRNHPDLFPSHGLKRPCPECGKKHVNNTNMLYHLKSHHLQQLTASCRVCRRKFLNQESLQAHIGKSHSNNPEPTPFLCTLCGSTFTTKGNFDAHEKAHFRVIQRRFSCHLCPRKYSTGYNLRAHLASHSDGRPFNCSNCQAAFKSLKDLKRHVAYTHIPSGGKFQPHACEFCGKEYRWNRKISLKEHLISVHHLSNEEAKVSAKMKPPFIRILEDGVDSPKRKPKTCNLCDRTYVRREGLFTHLIREHGKTLEEAKEITGLQTTRLGKILPKSYLENSSDLNQQ